MIIVGLALLLSFLLHLPHLQKDLVGLHVWRQAGTQNTIISFFEEDMSILHPRRSQRGNGDGIYRMEFPLMQWSIAAVYLVTGKSIFVTRICMFVCYLFAVFGAGFLGRKFFRREQAAIGSALLFCFSPEIFYHGINPMPDVLALGFTFWGLGFFFAHTEGNSGKKLWLSGLFLGLAALVKLPFILFFAVPGWAMVLSLTRKEENPAWKRTLPVLLLCAAPALAWYSAVIGTWTGNNIVGGVLKNTQPVSVLAGYLMYHLRTTIPELYINYAALPFFTFGAWLFFRNGKWKDDRGALLIPAFLLVCAYIVFEINMIEKVHDYYLFPLYPFILLTSTWGALNLFRRNSTFRWITILLFVALPVTAWLRTRNSWNTNEPGFNKNLLTYGSTLRHAVPDTSRCVIGNDLSQHIWFYYLQKKGWSFDNDHFDSVKLADKINLGAEYLYSDSRLLDENPSVKPLLDSLITTQGNIRVYKLRIPSPHDQP